MKDDMVENLHRTSHSSLLHHEGGLEEFYRLAHEVYVFTQDSSWYMCGISIKS